MTELYRVVQERTELIEYELLVDSPEDAEDRFLMDGTEIGAEIRADEVVSVALADAGGNQP
jgi:hypothetical protein